MNKLNEIFERNSKKVSMKIGIGFYDLQTGESAYWNKGDFFPTASVFKVHVMMAAFKEIEAGRLNLDDRVTLEKKHLDFISQFGSGVLKCLTAGCSLTVKDYITLMMIISDNVATDIVCDLVGMDNVKKVIEACGLTNTKLDFNVGDLLKKCAKIEEGDAPEEALKKGVLAMSTREIGLMCEEDSPNDSTSPHDMVKVLKAIYENSFVGEEYSKQMIAIMRQCQDEGRLTKYFPKYPLNTVVTAHKTGGIGRVVNDVGIVKTKKGDYILAVFTNGYYSEDEEFAANEKGNVAREAIAEISKEVFDYYLEDR